MKKFLLLILVFPLFSLAQTINSIEHYPSINLESGWNMIGYTCLDPMNVEDALLSLGDTVTIVKDNNGNVYLPEFNFNGIEQFEFGFGYQLKLSQAVFNFSFCPFLVPLVEGCTDEAVFNYNPSANWDDGSCIPFLYGCTDSLAFNYNIIANTDDYSCFPVVFGCADTASYNYNDFDSDGQPNELTGINGVDVNTDNGSCIPFIYGCTNQSAFNYNPQANTSDLNDLYCIPLITGCNIPTAYNFNDYDNDGEPNEYTGNPSIDVNTYEINSCIDKLYGCTDSTALNFSIEANTDNGSCIPFIYGCTDSLAYNYSILANTDDNSCIPFVYGCTDSTAINYSLETNTDDGSCIPKVFGCMDSLACNYNPEANMSDGSCTYSELGYDCDGNFVEYVVGMEAEGGIVFYVDETGERGLVAAMEDLTEGASDNSETGLIGFEWGCFGEYVDGADGTSLGTGYLNTIDIVNQGCVVDYGGITAAQAALLFESEGYSDWYLPSIDELIEMYNTFGNLVSEVNIGGFDTSIDSGWYWSSSTFDNLSWGASFNDGSPYYGDWRNGPGNVRPIRAFGYTLGCMDSLACNYNSEANMSDGSCTYSELGYDCDGNFVEYVVGMEAEGGIVFYVDSSGDRGLVAAAMDIFKEYADSIGYTYEWGCLSEYVSGADGFAIGTGYQNTLDIIEGCSENTAAFNALNSTAEGYTDWYLPSKDELYEMYNTIGNGGPEGDIGGFSNSYYWSSSENVSSNAWSVNFDSGYTGNVSKNNPGRVRVIRAFGNFPMFGCMDANATNYNAAATTQAINQYGESICFFNSCDDIPEYGCIYLDGFGTFNADFTAAQCAEYGGTPCDGSTSVQYICTDSTALEGSYFPYGDVESNLYMGDSILTINEWLVDNSTCMYSQVFVCIDSLACNYNPEANMSDGSCEYPELGYDCDGNSLITQDNIHVLVDAWLEDSLSAYAIYGHISDWDVSNITNMDKLFYGASSFNSNILEWDVSNVISMSNMFESASIFNRDISSWDVSNVDSMYHMFRKAQSFNVDISGWNVSNVRNMRDMFFGAQSFNVDLSQWDVSNVTNMTGMFEDAFSFDQNISDWDIASVNYFTNMFKNNLLSPENKCAIQSSFATNPYWTEDLGCIYQIGDLAEGGIVFYIDESGQHGLVAAMEDLEGIYDWGCYGMSLSDTFIEGTAIGTGYQNTLDIVSGCSETHIAASEALAYESEGHSDWYLPSKDELIEMYNTIGNGSPDGNIGGFQTSNYPNYWSSSVSIISWFAWSVSFSNGSTYNNLDYNFNTYRVRVIRAF